MGHRLFSGPSHDALSRGIPFEIEISMDDQKTIASTAPHNGAISRQANAERALM
jgi:hypothetical protein